MVYKDVTIGFTVAGVVAVFVPAAAFEALFMGAGEAAPGPLALLVQTVVGPVAAFFTFIGSMGNIPLAAVLFSQGVSFAGVMAFIFSDLVVLPVVRIQARYYGWRMAAFIAAAFLFATVAAALLLHLGFDLIGALPSAADAPPLRDRDFFALNTSFVLGMISVAFTALALGWRHRDTPLRLSFPEQASERVLLGVLVLCVGWLTGGLTAPWWA